MTVREIELEGTVAEPDPLIAQPSEPEGATDTMDVQCGICMDTMFPCQEVSRSECHPVSHVFHLKCYNRWLMTQNLEPRRCLACRQFEIREMEWYVFAEIFDFHPDDHQRVAELSEEAQCYIRNWQRGAITHVEMEARASAARQLRANRGQFV